MSEPRSLLDIALDTDGRVQRAVAAVLWRAVALGVILGLLVGVALGAVVVLRSIGWPAA